MRTAGALIALALATPAATQSQTYNLMNYWLNQALECTATNVAVPGTRNRNYQGPKIGCPSYQGRPLASPYYVEKGGWGTETYIIDGGYLVIMTESGAPNLCGPGSGATYREFIQRPSGLAGVNHLKVQFNAFEHWTFPPQTLKCGSSCLTSNLPDTDVDFGPQDGTDQTFVGTVAGFLYDCRPGRPCAGPPHAVEMIMKRDTWGSGAVQEEYYYARWRDPQRSNAWSSVGLVQWIEKTRQPNGTYVVTRQEVFNKLVQCSLTASCPSCP